jgi:hypothetical protein
MSRTYERIVTTAPYKAEIYDNCVSYLEMRKDRRRARVVVQGTKWIGNTGGYHEYSVYLNMDEARKLLRKYRRAVIDDNKGRCDNYYNPRHVLEDAIFGEFGF